MGEYELLAVTVLSRSYNNFVFLLCHNGQAVLIDAGEAAPVFEVLEQENLQLTDVLITHTHHDHMGGCRAILDRLGVQSTSPSIEVFEKEMLGTTCRSIFTPGHMMVHKCFHFPELGILFSGDAVINGGCGRILGGTAEQFFESLKKISALPDETRIFGAHDYLVDNMMFSIFVDPDNEETKRRFELYKTDPAAAIFVSLAEEKKTNPFFQAPSVDVFKKLRLQRDEF